MINVWGRSHMLTFKAHRGHSWRLDWVGFSEMPLILGIPMIWRNTSSRSIRDAMAASGARAAVFFSHSSKRQVCVMTCPLPQGGWTPRCRPDYLGGAG